MLRCLRLAPKAQRSVLAVLISACALAAACAPSPHADRPFDLRRSLQGATLELVVRDEALTARARAVHPDAMIDGESRAGDSAGTPVVPRARILVGRFSDEHIRPWLARMGVEHDAESVTIAGERYANPGDVLLASFADPDRPGLPLNLLCAQRAEDLTGFLDDLRPAWRPSLTLFSRGFPLLRTELSLHGRVRSETLRTDTSSLDEFQRRYRVRLDDALLVYAPDEVDDAALTRYVAATESAGLRLARWLGDEAGEEQEAQAERVTLVLHLHTEDLVRFGHGDRWPSFDPRTGVAHALIHGLLPDDGGAAPLLGRARLALGPAARPRIERAAAIEASDVFWGKTLEAWVGELCAAGLGPEPEFPVATERHAASPLRWTALDAFFWRHLIEEKGAEHVRAIWSGDRPFTCDAELRKSFDTRLAELATRAGSAPHRPLPTGFLVGANVFASDRTLHGFGSRASERSLKELRGLAANSVSLMPRAVWELGDAEWAGGALPEVNEGGDGDLGVAATIAHARSEGFTVFLRPELWVSPSGNLAGRLTWGDEGPWNTFFERYADFVEHFGLLGRLCGVDGFFIGGDLPEAFGTEGSDEEVLTWKRAQWPRVTDRARRAFPGGLGYGALWPNQVRKLGIWPALDFCGVDIFHNLRDPERPSMRTSDRVVLDRLRAALFDACEVGSEAERPVIVSAIGFLSRERAWDTVSIGGGAVDLEEQERLYTSLSRALIAVRAERPNLAGVLLWDWSTDPDSGGPNDGGFTPQNKPAAAVVRSLFERLK